MKKYIHISNDIKNKIVDGTFKANDKLPSEKELGVEYDASKMTVKQALDILVAEGLIIKRRGAGTFIKDLSTTELKRVSLTNQFRGKTAEHPQNEVTSKVLNFSVIQPDEKIQDKLNISEDDFVYFIYRVRYVDGIPNAIEETYMPINLIMNLKLKHVKQSIYDYIESELGLVIQSAHRIITVRGATEAEAAELQMQPHEPVGIAEQVGYLSSGAAFEYSTTTHHYNYFKAELVLTK
ncbi:GntR family transcriptional regulator [Enterococcus sp. AZ196]|uniref:GntR family transcriptional regulator n=1 Tax=Enterococcus sp. AZ196 TaxID=2774659 RepID=UPI003D2A29D7